MYIPCTLVDAPQLPPGQVAVAIETSEGERTFIVGSAHVGPCQRGHQLYTDFSGGSCDQTLVEVTILSLTAEGEPRREGVQIVHEARPAKRSYVLSV